MKDKIIFFDWLPAYAGEDLEQGKTELSVFCPILTPLYSDEYINSEISGINIKDLKTNGGDECGGAIDISSCVKAKYFGRSNFTTPCIHKGESVLLSSNVNGVYYWKEIGINDSYRLQEKVSLRAANKLNTVEELTDDNTYILDLDSIKKNIIIKTTKLLPNEKTYTLKMDVANSQLFIADSDGNSILLDTNIPNIKVSNKHQTFIEVNNKNVNISAPGSVNIKAGTLVKIEAPSTHIKSNITVIDGVDLSINSSQSTVVTTPTFGVNGLVNVTTGVVSNLISGAAIASGGSASTTPSATIDDSSETGTGSGAPELLLPTPPSDTAASYTKILQAITEITTVLTNLGVAITATNDEHTGPTTAPSAAAAAIVAALPTSISSILTTTTSATLPNVQGDVAP